MMPRSSLRPIGGIVFAFALAFALPAFAGEAADDGLAPYFELDGHSVWVTAPGVERAGTVALDFTTNDQAGRRHIDADGEVESWGGGFDTRVGFAVPRDLLPGWQMEFGASYLKVNEHSNDETRLQPVGFDFSGPPPPMDLPVEFLFPTPIDGTPVFGVLAALGGPPFIGFPTQQVLTSFVAEYSAYDLRLQVARPVSFLGLDSEKVRIGLLGGEIDQDYQIEQQVRGGAVRWVEELDEQAESWFIGPVFGAEIGFSVMDAVRVSVELETALLAQNTSMNADQDFQIFIPGPNDASINLSETDEETHFNSRSRIEANVEYDFGWAILGVSGAFTYATYAPEIINPRAQRDTSVFFSSPSEARLSSGDMMMAEFGARITIPFGGN